MIKKHLLIVFVLGLTILPLMPLSKVAAVDVLNPACQNADPNNLPSVCKENQSNTNDNPLFGPGGVLTKAINIISLVIGITAVIVIIIAGMRFIVSTGDPQRVATARTTVIYAAVGLAIAASAQFIVAFVLSKL